MKAMILAAGLGTRLRPLTDRRPKALVEVAERTLLDLTLARLRGFGINEVIVNVHHFADMVVDYLRANDDFGMRIEISREQTLLDTGGGIRKAAWFFLEDGDAPFLVHNVDVLSTIDLELLARYHAEHEALATLAVKNRETSRYLLFDEQGNLCGRRAGNGGEPQMVRAAARTEALAFSGIHVLSPRIFAKLAEDGPFSIISAYLRLAGEGERIAGFRADGYYWRDLGRMENVAQAAQDIANGA